MSSPLTDAERAELVERWRERAKHLEQTAASYRRMGDAEYAQEIERAALDNIAAADALELGVTA